MNIYPPLPSSFFLATCPLIHPFIPFLTYLPGLFLALVPPLSVIYWRVQGFFRKTNTELKRIENISRSPIYTEFQEVLHGVTSLRAFGEQQSFITRMETHLDENNNVNVLQQIVTWWLNIRLDMISAATSFFVGALAVGDPTFLPQKYLGLALSNAGNLTAMMKMTVAQFATVSRDWSLITYTITLTITCLRILLSSFPPHLLTPSLPSLIIFIPPPPLPFLLIVT